MARLSPDAAGMAIQLPDPAVPPNRPEPPLHRLQPAGVDPHALAERNPAGAFPVCRLVVPGLHRPALLYRLPACRSPCAGAVVGACRRYTADPAADPLYAHRPRHPGRALA